MTIKYFATLNKRMAIERGTLGKSLINHCNTIGKNQSLNP